MLRRRRYLLNTFVLGRSGGFSPRSLFAAGEQGAWYDPSDITTLFQDSAGTTPVAAPGQFVARILDKSGRGNHATQTGATSVMPVYQVDATGRGYLAFDGVDDWLQTGSITPGADKVQVIAGVRKLSDVAAGCVAETQGSAGVFTMFAPGTAGLAEYVFRSGGTTPRFTATPATYSAPTTNVVTGIGDISGDVVRIRANGVQANESFADQGTGNYAAGFLSIGRRTFVAAPLNGRIYGLIVRFGANLSDAQISAAERWMNRRTGAF